MIGAFAGTAYAALSYMDTGPSADTLRAERAKRDAVLARRDRKARRAAARRVASTRRRAVPPARRWSARADAICDKTYDDAWSLLDPGAEPSPESVMRFLDEAVRLGDGLVAALDRLGPAPDKKAYARLMRTLRASQAADRRALASLRSAPSPALLARWLQDSVRVNEQIRALMLGLGSTACSELYDPAAF